MRVCARSGKSWPNARRKGFELFHQILCNPTQTYTIERHGKKPKLYFWREYFTKKEVQFALKDTRGDTCGHMACLINAALARAINQIAEETGVDRKMLCDKFLEYCDGYVPEASHDVIQKIAKSFAVSVPDQ